MRGRPNNKPDFWCVLVCKCADVQICRGAQVQRCRGPAEVQLQWTWSCRGYADEMQKCRCRSADAEVQMQKFRRSAEVQKCRNADVQMLDVQMCIDRHAELQICRFAEVQRCRGAEVQRCRGAEVQRWIGG